MKALESEQEAYGCAGKVLDWMSSPTWQKVSRSHITRYWIVC